MLRANIVKAKKKVTVCDPDYPLVSTQKCSFDYQYSPHLVALGPLLAPFPNFVHILSGTPFNATSEFLK